LSRKRGSRQTCNTKIYQPSFPLVLAGKIPTKYQPIPTKNTSLGYKSTNTSHLADIGKLPALVGWYSWYIPVGIFVR
jgi:hypothetical protein